MKIILSMILIGLSIAFVSEDRTSIRILETLLPPHEIKKIRLKFILPGYAIWKLRNLRKEIFDESKSENNPKRG
jgi:hypothetical protein